MMNYLKKFILTITLATAIILTWSPSYRAPYLFDDYAVPVADPASVSLSNWYKSLGPTLRPLTKLTFAVESELKLTEAPARRNFNYLVLTASGLLFFLILLHFGFSISTATLISLIFVTHPLLADNFILLAGRSALLEQFFILASLLLLIKNKYHYAILFAATAILSRETAIIVSICILFLAFRIAKPTIVKKYVFGILGLLFCALPFLSQPFQDLISYSMNEVGSTEHLGLQFAALSRGLLWIVYPINLTIDHDFHADGLERLLWICASLLVIYFSFIGYFQSQRQYSKGNSSFLFLILGILIILPTQSFFGKIDVLTERPFATALPFLLISLSLFARQFIPKNWKNIIKTVLALTIALYSFQTWRRCLLFLDEVTIWQEAAELSTKSTRPLVNLGTLLVQQGHYSAALPYLEKAQSRNPFDFNIQKKIEAVHVLMNQ